IEENDRAIMLKTDAQLYRFLKQLEKRSPAELGRYVEHSSGWFRKRAEAMMNKYHMVPEYPVMIIGKRPPVPSPREQVLMPDFVRYGSAKVREEYFATWARIRRFEEMGREAVKSGSAEGHPADPAHAWDPYYQAWNFAREEYRKVNLKGGDPILRNAEHYLF